MDYIRNLGSAAVSSLVQKSGLTLPFSLGSKTPYDGIWNLYDATKRDDGSAISVFEFDVGSSGRKDLMPLAKNTLRKLRSTRHPEVLKFIDAVETDTTIYILTERIRPLAAVLSTWSTKSDKEKEDWLVWGLHRISIALTFLNDPCTSTHGNICVSSIFISPSGEWRLGGFELMSNTKDDAAILYSMGSLMPNAMSWAPPEVKKGGWSSLKGLDPSVADAYALGLLLHSVFNPSHPLPPTATPPHPPPQPSSRGAIPTTLFAHYKRLLNPNSKARLSPKAFLEIGNTESGFFSTNRLVQVCNGLDNFALSSEGEKVSLLRNLKETSNSLPLEFVSHRVLPSLISALEYGGASAASILPLVLQFGKNVPPQEYPTVILAPLIKLYGSPDRGTRMALLDHLPEYAEHLDKKTVSDKVWPHLQTGFLDTVAIIREATVKSISLLSSKLSDRILNNELLRHLAKMQGDPEPSIRTNTCILIGRLGPSLGYHTKRKVLVPAFARALKDPFVHARVAGLMALMATVDCYDVEDLAGKVIPNMSLTVIDKEKLVRDQAFKALDVFIKKLEAHAAAMPETALSENGQPAQPATAVIAGQNGVVNSAAGAAGALAGWAISSLGKKLATSDMQSVMPVSAAATIERTMSASPAAGIDQASSSTSPPIRTSKIGPTPSRSRGLQLGGHAKTSITPMASLADELAEEAAAEEGLPDGSNPWGGDDLIDINADEDDWSAFETAPAASPVPVPKVTASPAPTFKAPQPVRAQPLSGLTPPGISVKSTASTPVSSPPPVSSSKPASPTPTASVSKEDRAAEMARRKEERKQRIAQLKEQKRSASAASAKA